MKPLFARSKPAETILGFLRTLLNLRYLIFVAISPFLLLFDLFRRRRRPRRDWLLYYLIFTITVFSLTGLVLIVRHYNSRHAMEVMTSYQELKVSVQDVPYSDLINIYAVKNQLDPALVAAVIKQESRFQPEAVSARDARGLMQIRPATWREIAPESSCSGDHAPHISGEDCIFHPEANIRAGTAYLRELLDFFQDDLILALSAYNAGYGNMYRYRDQEAMGGIPPFRETRHYVGQVIAYWQDYRHQEYHAAGSWRNSLSFPLLAGTDRTDVRLLGLCFGLVMFLAFWLLRRVV